jgi:hypothetical protein
MVARVLPFFVTETVAVKIHDRVRDVMEGVEGGRLKGKAFEKAIRDFSFEELERLSDQLIHHYARKFR